MVLQALTPDGDLVRYNGDLRILFSSTKCTSAGVPRGENGMLAITLGVDDDHDEVHVETPAGGGALLD